MHRGRHKRGISNGCFTCETLLLGSESKPSSLEGLHEQPDVIPPRDPLEASTPPPPASVAFGLGGGGGEVTGKT